MRKLTILTDGAGVQVETCELSLLEVKTALDVLLALVVKGEFPHSAELVLQKDKKLEREAILAIRDLAARGNPEACAFLTSHGFELTESEQNAAKEEEE